MDVTKLMTEILSTYWYFIPIFMIIGLIKTSWFKGVLGEFIVNLLTKISLDKDTYHLIKDVTLPTEKGSTQIDHIIVSKYGIFVVETKNMKGWIFGSENQKKWTQQIFKHRNQFQNPLHQNYKHTKTLASLLSIDESKIYSLVVFIGDSKFKTAMPNNVTQGTGYIKYIKSKTVEVFSETEVDSIIEMIERGKLDRSFATNRQHVKHLKQINAEKENHPHCPKCESSMILREVKKGQHIGKKFWGCQHFSKCRGAVKYFSH